MPLCTDPQKLFEVCLASDESQPEVTRPVFIFRHLTAREQAALAPLAERDEEQINRMPLADLIAELAGAVRVNLVGWRNLDRDYDPAALEDVCNTLELWELFFKCRRASHLDPAAKNASGQPSPSPAAASATAAPAPTSAMTP